MSEMTKALQTNKPTERVEMHETGGVERHRTKGVEERKTGPNEEHGKAWRFQEESYVNSRGT